MICPISSPGLGLGHTPNISIHITPPKPKKNIFLLLFFPPNNPTTPPQKKREGHRGPALTDETETPKKSQNGTLRSDSSCFTHRGAAKFWKASVFWCRAPNKGMPGFAGKARFGISTISTSCTPQLPEAPKVSQARLPFGYLGPVSQKKKKHAKHTNDDPFWMKFWLDFLMNLIFL